MVLEPIFEVDFSRNSYGFRPNRCTKDAVAYIGLRLINPPSYGWVIEGDIQSFFDTIDHQKMRRLLERRIRDRKLLTLIGKFLKAGVMEQGKIRNTTLGTPQGGIISPLLANIYLHELDRYMEQLTDLSEYAKAYRKKKGHGNFLYCRYADDFVVLCDGTKGHAEAMRQELSEFLATELKLTLSMEKTKITHVGEGFRFLGFWIERNIGMSGKLAPRIRIPEEAVTRFRAKMQMALSKSTCGDSLNTKILALNRITRGWCQYYQTTSSPHFYFGKLSYEMYRLMAHWLGRKYKLSGKQVYRKFRREGTFGTNQRVMLEPRVFKAIRYRAKTIHNQIFEQQHCRSRASRGTRFLESESLPFECLSLSATEEHSCCYMIE